MLERGLETPGVLVRYPIVRRGVVKLSGGRLTRVQGRDGEDNSVSSGGGLLRGVASQDKACYASWTETCESGTRDGGAIRVCCY